MRWKIGFISICMLLATIRVQGGIHIVQPSMKIKAAIEAASPGDTIWVKEGTYLENLIEIRKPVSLIGEGWPIIDAQGGDEIIIVFSDSVLIKGFQLQNVGVDYLKDRAAIRLVGAREVRIKENQLYNNFFGIYLQNARECKLINNEITGDAVEETTAGNAIHLWKSDKIQILDNRISRHRDGLYFEFVDSSFISGNSCVNNVRYGLHFMFSNHDVYQDNLFDANGVGVAVMFSRNIQMLQNVFKHNWGPASYGILLKEISDGRMENNLFFKNTKAIMAEGVNRLYIRQNIFKENGWAIDIKGNCLDNQITENDFLLNTYEVITNSKENRNFFDRNYWSHYRGYDLDRDGEGDIPHRPVSLFALLVDRIPAAAMMMHSFLSNLMGLAEQMFPHMIPAKLLDAHPKTKPYMYDRNRRTI